MKTCSQWFQGCIGYLINVLLLQYDTAWFTLYIYQYKFQLQSILITKRPKCGITLLNKLAGIDKTDVGVSEKQDILLPWPQVKCYPLHGKSCNCHMTITWQSHAARNVNKAHAYLSLTLSMLEMASRMTSIIFVSFTLRKLQRGLMAPIWTA